MLRDKRIERFNRTDDLRPIEEQRVADVGAMFCEILFGLFDGETKIKPTVGLGRVFAHNNAADVGCADHYGRNGAIATSGDELALNDGRQLNVDLVALNVKLVGAGYSIALL